MQVPYEAWRATLFLDEVQPPFPTAHLKAFFGQLKVECLTEPLVVAASQSLSRRLRRFIQRFAEYLMTGESAGSTDGEIAERVVYMLQAAVLLRSVPDHESETAVAALRSALTSQSSMAQTIAGVALTMACLQTAQGPRPDLCFRFGCDVFFSVSDTHVILDPVGLLTPRAAARMMVSLCSMLAPTPARDVFVAQAAVRLLSLADAHMDSSPFAQHTTIGNSAELALALEEFRPQLTLIGPTIAAASPLYERITRLLVCSDGVLGATLFDWLCALASSSGATDLRGYRSQALRNPVMSTTLSAALKTGAPVHLLRTVELLAQSLNYGLIADALDSVQPDFDRDTAVALWAALLALVEVHCVGASLSPPAHVAFSVVSRFPDVPDAVLRGRDDRALAAADLLKAAALTAVPGRLTADVIHGLTPSGKFAVPLATLPLALRVVGDNPDMPAVELLHNVLLACLRPSLRSQSLVPVPRPEGEDWGAALERVPREALVPVSAAIIAASERSSDLVFDLPGTPQYELAVTLTLIAQAVSTPETLHFAATLRLSRGALLAPAAFAYTASGAAALAALCTSPPRWSVRAPFHSALLFCSRVSWAGGESAPQSAIAAFIASLGCSRPGFLEGALTEAPAGSAGPLLSSMAGLPVTVGLSAPEVHALPHLAGKVASLMHDTATDIGRLLDCVVPQLEYFERQTSDACIGLLSQLLLGSLTPYTSSLARPPPVPLPAIRQYQWHGPLVERLSAGLPAPLPPLLQCVRGAGELPMRVRDSTLLGLCWLLAATTADTAERLASFSGDDPGDYALCAMLATATDAVLERAGPGDLMQTFSEVTVMGALVHVCAALAVASEWTSLPPDLMFALRQAGAYNFTVSRLNCLPMGVVAPYTLDAQPRAPDEDGPLVTLSRLCGIACRGIYRLRRTALCRELSTLLQGVRDASSLLDQSTAQCVEPLLTV